MNVKFEITRHFNDVWYSNLNECVHLKHVFLRVKLKEQIGIETHTQKKLTKTKQKIFNL